MIGQNKYGAPRFQLVCDVPLCSELWCCDFSDVKVPFFIVGRVTDAEAMLPVVIAAPPSFL